MNKLIDLHHHMIDVVETLGDHKTWFKPGYLAGAATLLLSPVAQAQNVPDLTGTLTKAKTGVKSVLDWVVWAIIAAVFVGAIYGIAFGLFKIASGQREGVGALILGVAAAIVGIGLVSVFAAGYKTAVA